MSAPLPFDIGRIGAGLPFAACADELTAALGGAQATDGAAAGAVVVEAPPGTGKTTLVPPIVANWIAHSALGSSAAGARTQRVVVTQPRRIAAGAASRRLAQLTGTRVGELVGITVRGRREVGPDTLVEVVTPGVLLRRLLNDPGLSGVGAVVLDEVHERGLETDLLVGMLAEVRTLRDDLAVVAMSATLDAAHFAELLEAQVVSATSVLHPLEVEWAPPPGAFNDARGLSRDFLEHVVATTSEAWTRHADTAHGDGDALVFLPAANDVSRVAERLAPRVSGVDVLELHGRLPLAEQDRVTAGRRAGDSPRIVVTTAVAESSLTVPGVRLVVDAGLSREPRRDATRGMSGLVTVRCSRDSAVQRAGRAAREGAGVVVRCYDATRFAAMPEHVTPQVAVADLTGAALVLAAWGAPSGVGLPLPDPLPAAALADATSTLTDLGALGADGRITSIGRTLAAVPTDPRLARALLAEQADARTAADVVAMLGDDLRPEGADLPGLLAALRSGRHPGSGRWRQESARLARLVGERAADGPRQAVSRSPDIVGHLVALAYPRWIARRRGDTYLFASGTRAALPPGSPLSGHEWLAVADVARAQGRATESSGAMIRAAAPLSEETAMLAGASLLVDEERCRLDGGRATARRVRRLGAIELSSTPVAPSAAGLADMWRDVLGRNGLGILPPDPGADALRRRLAFCHLHLGDPWPDVSDDALLARLDRWFDLSATRVGDIRLGHALRAMMPWPEASRLDELAPERLTVADGRSARVEYPEDSTDPAQRPVVAVRLQSCFGMTRTPRLADGRVPVLFHLLSPAGRPLAITDDLASFWAGPYSQVRAEMRGRYPKHPWPENPAGPA